MKDWFDGDIIDMSALNKHPANWGTSPLQESYPAHMLVIETVPLLITERLYASVIVTSSSTP